MVHMIQKRSLFISKPESAYWGVDTENCSGINQTLSIFLSFIISLLVISFATRELVIGLV